MNKSFYLLKTAVNELKIADIAYNYKNIEKIIKDNKDASVLLFPLLSTSSFSLGNLFLSDDILNLCLDNLINLSTKVESTLVCISLPIKYLNSIYIGIAYLNNKKIIGISPLCLCNINKNVKKFFTCGKKVVNKEIVHNNISIPFSNDIVCYDKLNEVTISTNIDSDIILMPRCDNALIDNIDDIKKDIEFISKKNNSINMYVTGKNESSTDLVYIPKSYIYQNGDLLIESDFIKHNVSQIVVNPNISKLRKVNNKVNEHSVFNVSINNIGTINKLKEYNFDVNPNPFVNLYAQKYNEIINLVANGLVNRVRNTNIYNLVIGVSGGLDSTFALLVINKAKEIENKIKVYAYSLPYIKNTSNITKTNALALMKLYNYESINEIKINRSVDRHLIDIKHDKKDITYENAQARYRTYVLMDVANKVSGMVIGTGDLSESALGFCTFNGDHMSMYNLNASLPKTLIKECIRLYMLNNATTKKEKAVLSSIINTPISPELQENKNGLVGQKTEEEIGSYELNDFILYYHLKYNLSIEHIYLYLQLAYPNIKKKDLKKTIYNFYKRFYKQQFKRNCCSDGVKVIDFSLSPRSDYSLPSDINIDSILELIDKL